MFLIAFSVVRIYLLIIYIRNYKWQKNVKNSFTKPFINAFVNAFINDYKWVINDQFWNPEFKFLNP